MGKLEVIFKIRLPFRRTNSTSRNFWIGTSRNSFSNPGR